MVWIDHQYQNNLNHFIIFLRLQNAIKFFVSTCCFLGLIAEKVEFE
jgi:hypothetical protein